MRLFRDGFLLEVVVVVVVVLAGVATGLNSDGVALLAFKAGIWSDPQGVLRNWRSADPTPCWWTGITCVRIQATGEDRVVGIDLCWRALEGTIASSLGDLGHLEVVDLGYNKLTGRIPAEIAACFGLRRLVFSHNRIVGAIPAEIGSKLVVLERLDLAVNELSGFIPDNFGNLSSLLPQAALNLSNNHLTGPIPPSLGNLRQVPIDLSNNQLSGRIPTGSYFQSQGPVAYIGNAALCGSPLKVDCAFSASPSPSSSPQVRISSPREDPSLSKAAVVAIAVGSGIVGIMLTASLILCILMTIRNSKNSRLHRGDSASRCLCSWRTDSFANGGDDDGDSDGDLVHLSGEFSFSLEQLLRASAYVLGKSGVGIVYKAVLDDGNIVAVRRLGEGGELKRKEFESEVKSIAQVRHPNVVGLHSYSWTPDEKLLVYDFLPNGSLETALHGGCEGEWKGMQLPWEARVRIASGAAQGLAHLHERKQSHGDIKPSNILLDVFLHPRIADLGLQRLQALLAHQPAEQSSASLVTCGAGRGGDSRRSASFTSPMPEFKVWSSTSTSSSDTPFSMGTMYQAPEVKIMAKRATAKSDVYAFGVVLLELLTGRSPFKQMEGCGQLDLVSWLRFALQQKNPLCEIFDPALLINVNYNLQTKMVETLQVALACIAMNPDSRPKMKQVAEIFEQILASS